MMKMAWMVISDVAHRSADISQRFDLELPIPGTDRACVKAKHLKDDKILLKVNLDNCSHASGIQRAYIACPMEHHKACFRYKSVHLMPSQRRLTAWLCCWALHAAPHGESFSKDDHKGHDPDDAAVDEIMRALPHDV